MYYTMRLVEGVPNRVGRMTRSIDSRIRQASKYGRDGYVEKYGVGVVWTPSQAAALRGTIYERQSR